MGKLIRRWQRRAFASTRRSSRLRCNPTATRPTETVRSSYGYSLGWRSLPPRVGGATSRNGPQAGGGLRFPHQRRPAPSTRSRPRCSTAPRGARRTTYNEVAPDPEAFGALVARRRDLDSTPYDWLAEAMRAIKAPTLIVIGDGDGTPPGMPSRAPSARRRRRLRLWRQRQDAGSAARRSAKAPIRLA
jgi:hypothetical protein